MRLFMSVLLPGTAGQQFPLLHLPWPNPCCCSGSRDQAGLVEVWCLKAQQVEVGGCDVGQASIGQVVAHHHIVGQALAADVYGHRRKRVAGQREGLACTHTHTRHTSHTSHTRHTRHTMPAHVTRGTPVRVTQRKGRVSSTHVRVQQRLVCRPLATRLHNASVRQSDSPESASSSGLLVFFSRCTMSSLLPWSEVTRNLDSSSSKQKSRQSTQTVGLHATHSTQHTSSRHTSVPYSLAIQLFTHHWRHGAQLAGVSAPSPAAHFVADLQQVLQALVHNSTGVDGGLEVTRVTHHVGVGIVDAHLGTGAHTHSP